MQPTHTFSAHNPFFQSTTHTKVFSPTVYLSFTINWKQVFFVFPESEEDYGAHILCSNNFDRYEQWPSNLHSVMFLHSHYHWSRPKRNGSNPHSEHTGRKRSSMVFMSNILSVCYSH